MTDATASSPYRVDLWQVAGRDQRLTDPDRPNGTDADKREDRDHDVGWQDERRGRAGEYGKRPPGGRLPERDQPVDRERRGHGRQSVHGDAEDQAHRPRTEVTGLDRRDRGQNQAGHEAEQVTAPRRSAGHSLNERPGHGASREQQQRQDDEVPGVERRGPKDRYRRSGEPGLAPGARAEPVALEVVEAGRSTLATALPWKATAGRGAGRGERRTWRPASRPPSPRRRASRAARRPPRAASSNSAGPAAARVASPTQKRSAARSRPPGRTSTRRWRTRRPRRAARRRRGLPAGDRDRGQRGAVREGEVAGRGRNRVLAERLTAWSPPQITRRSQARAEGAVTASSRS